MRAAVQDLDQKEKNLKNSRCLTILVGEKLVEIVKGLYLFSSSASPVKDTGRVGTFHTAGVLRDSGGRHQPRDNKSFRVFEKTTRRA